MLHQKAKAPAVSAVNVTSHGEPSAGRRFGYGAETQFRSWNPSVLSNVITVPCTTVGEAGAKSKSKRTIISDAETAVVVVVVGAVVVVVVVVVGGVVVVVAWVSVADTSEVSPRACQVFCVRLWFMLSGRGVRGR